MKEQEKMNKQSFPPYAFGLHFVCSAITAFLLPVTISIVFLPIMIVALFLAAIAAIKGKTHLESWVSHVFIFSLLVLFFDFFFPVVDDVPFR